MKRLIKSISVLVLACSMMFGQVSFQNFAVQAAQEDQVVHEEDFSDTTQERDVESIEFSALDINDLKQFNVAPIYDVKSNKMLLPRIEGYNVALFGSDRKETVSLLGEVTRPLNTQSVQLLYKITNKSDGSVVTTEKNAVVKIPGKTFDFQGENEKPNVVPALREWVGGDESIAVNGSIVIDNETLRDVASSFKEDYEDITGRNISITVGNEETLKRGDVYFTLSDELSMLGKEGYYLEIGGADTTNDYVVVRANQNTGALYGGISILQILKQDVATLNLPRGIARDYPLFERRGMMLDAARKWIPVSYLKDLTKQMSWYKLNMLSIHLSDNDIWNSLSTDGGTDPEGFFRLECETFPGLTSTDHYTKEEFRDYQEYSMNLGINVIPELDTPGHALAYTDLWPELSLPNNPKYLDVTNPQVLENMKAIFDEYINGYEGGEATFVGPDVNIGTDEYKVSGSVYKEGFRAYCDALLKYVKSQGKNAVFWGSLTENAGSTPVTNDATMFAWYYGYANAKQSLNAGFKIVSMEDQEVYIVPGGGYYANQFGRAEYLYNSWVPNNNAGWVGSPAPAGHPGVVGGQFAVWNDYTGNGISVNDISYRIQHNLYTIAEKCWAGTERKAEGVTYSQFEASATALGDAPNTDFLYRDSIKTEQNEVLKLDDTVNNLTKEGTGVSLVDDKNITEEVAGKHGKALSFTGGESYIETDAISTGFGWTSAMWLNLDEDNPKNAILMEGKTGTLRIEDGMIKYDVEQYTHSFNYTLPVNTWTHVALSGTYEGVKLYINGEMIDELKDKPYPNYNFNSGCNSWNGSYPQVDGKKTVRYYETLMLPITVIGSKTNAIKASVDELQVYNRVLDQREIDVLVGNTPAESYVNLALHKTVTASGSETANFAPEKAVDGDVKTRWSSPTSTTIDNQAWYMVDLGTIKSINNVKIVWEDAFAKKYKVLISEDGTNFSEVYDEKDGKGGTSNITFDMSRARYVKFQGIERRGDNQWIEAYSFYEFEVYGEETTDAPKKNIALHKDVTTTYFNDASSEADRSGSKAVDGSIDSRWEFKLSRNDANTISIPLNKEEDANKIFITERLWGSETTRIANIKVEAIGVEGGGNKTLLSETTYAPDQTPSGSPRHGEKTITFDTIKAERINITLTPKASGGDDLVNIAEIAMYGTQSEEETPIPPVEDTYEKIPHKTMAVFASDEHPNVGAEGLAAFAIDDSASTWWHTNYSSYKGLPQSITLDLKEIKTVGKYSYLPRNTGSNGIITSYELQVSIDNETYQSIAQGSWTNDASEKNVTFTPINARYVRLIAKAGVGNFASAAELNAYTSENVSVDTLRNAVDAAKALNLENYLDDSKQALLDTLKVCEDVLNGTVDEEALIKANEQLRTAMNNLALKGDKTELQALYDSTSEILPSDYTIGSYRVFDDVLKEMKKVLDQESVISQKIIDAFKDQLSEAQQDLISVKALKAFISQAEAISLEDCTVVTATQLRVTLANAKLQLQSETATLYDVTKAQYDLQDVMAALQPDAKALGLLIASYEENAQTYTEESWNTFVSVLNDAKAVFDNADASIVELYKARTILSEKANEILVKKAATSHMKDILKHVIDKADVYVADESFDILAPSVATIIQRRLTEAKAVYADPASNDIAYLNAWLNLANALHYIDFVADKGNLHDLIVECEAIDTSEYIEGVEAFETALATAKEVYDDENALQERINVTYQTLLDAKHGLVKTTVDKDALQTLVNAIETTIGDGSAYNKNEAWDIFQVALQNANNALVNKDVTQVEINTAMLTLASAYENIRLLPNEAILKELQSFVEIIDTISTEKYTSDHIVYFQQARARVVSFMNEYDETKLPEMRELMQDVLQKINDEVLLEPEVEKQPEEVETPNKETSFNEALRKPSSSVAQTKGATKTGDDTNVVGLGVSVIVASGILLQMKKRKKHSNNRK